MTSHGKWDTLAARVYYVLGTLYYLGAWFVTLGIAGYILSFVSIYFGIYRASGVTLAVFSTAALGWAIFVWIKGVRNRYLGPNPSLRLLEVDVSFAVLGGGNFRTTRTIKAVSTREGTDHYKHRFYWTGTDKAFSPEPASGRVKSIQILPESATRSHRICRVEFDRPLGRGEVIEFRYSFSLADSGGSFQKFHASTIRDAVKQKVRLRTSFLAEAPGVFKKAIFLSDAAEIPIWEDSISLDGGGSEALWEIRRPRNHHRYVISW